MTELTDFQKECIRLALAKMFKSDGYFSICTVDTCLKLTGAVPPRNDYEALHALHCVSFRDMTPAMRQQVAQQTLALFDHPGFDIPQLDKSFLPPREGELVTLTLWQRAKGVLRA